MSLSAGLSTCKSLVKCTTAADVRSERWLMEGAYNKVYHARERLPREEYEVLIVTLLTTVRYVSVSDGR